MKKIKYSAGIKAVALMLAELFSVSLVVCIILVSTLLEKGMLDVWALQEQSFAESGYYQSLFLESVEELLDYIAYQEQFEPDEEEKKEVVVGFLNGEITLEEVQAYQGGEEVIAYKRLANKYQRETSNLKFWIYAGNYDRYYTNLTDPSAAEDLLRYGSEELGSYFYYDKEEIFLDTNVEGMEDAFYDTLEARIGGESSVFFVGVDMALPHADDFSRAGEEYQLLKPWAVTGLMLCVISVFGCFLCFVYLSMAAGRQSADERIHLGWFDRIKTELLMVGFGGICLAVAWMLQALSELFRESDMIGMMIMAGGLTFPLVALFLIFYMSFVRRLKAGELWRGSLLCWIGRGIQKLIKNWRPSVRILAAFAGHLLLTLALVLLTVRWQGNGWRMGMVAVAYLLLCGAEALQLLREGVQRNTVLNGIRRISGGDLEYEIDTAQLKGSNRAMGEAVNTIGEGLYHAVDERTKTERLKADLITNVSHDIKTPLTSIINYVDLLKRENLDNPRAKSYISILDAKSQRLKQLTEDLVEVSKISSGNITLQMERLNLVELVHQTGGEFNEAFETRGLTVITRLPQDPVVILADGRRIWRVIENLYTNVAKYALENTRVYVDMEVLEAQAVFSIKNISKQPLNIDASELTERFIRGDVSRSTEGSGLGLSIAENLTKLMGGGFHIYLDGDLFKVTVTFPVVEEERHEKNAG